LSIQLCVSCDSLLSRGGSQTRDAECPKRATGAVPNAVTWCGNAICHVMQNAARRRKHLRLFQGESSVAQSEQRSPLSLSTATRAGPRAGDVRLAQGRHRGPPQRPAGDLTRLKVEQRLALCESAEHQQPPAAAGTALQPPRAPPRRRVSVGDVHHRCHRIIS